MGPRVRKGAMGEDIPLDIPAPTPRQPRQTAAEEDELQVSETRLAHTHPTPDAAPQSARQPRSLVVRLAVRCVLTASNRFAAGVDTRSSAGSDAAAGWSERARAAEGAREGSAAAAAAAAAEHWGGALGHAAG